MDKILYERLLNIAITLLKSECKLHCDCRDCHLCNNTREQKFVCLLAGPPSIWKNLNVLEENIITTVKEDITAQATAQAIARDIMYKVKLEYMGKHPDELHQPYYYYDIIQTVERICHEVIEEGLTNGIKIY